MKSNNQVLKMEMVYKYKKIVLDMLKHSFPHLSNDEIEEAVNYSIMKRIKNFDITINNNYKNKKINTTLLQLIEYIEKRKPILTAYGVMFSKHNTEPNPLANLLNTFMKNREIHKKKMFKYPKGSEMFEKYNLLQLLDKIDANGSYGAIGQYSCLLYNIYVAASITAQGRSCISAAGLFFEMFLANNVKFESLNEIITFIYNVINEKNERQYNDNDILDEDITKEECFYKIIMTCGFNYIPDDKDLDIIWDIICDINQEDINRLYYKNNLYSFMENKSMTKAIIYILKMMDEPYLDPRIDKVPKNIEVELNEFCNLLKEYVYYHYQVIDRLDRYDNMIRSICVITDTDSTIISLDGWYRYILEKIKNIPMKIKHEKIDIVKRYNKDEFGDVELINPIERIETPIEYSFYDDKTIQMQNIIEPLKIIPQEGLRYSIINIIGYCLSKLILDYMDRYTMGSNSWLKNKKCLIIMKNEYLFKKILLTNMKKFYASIQELQEGHVIKGGMLDIKGLPMAKSTLNKKSRDRLQKILYEEIMNKEDINQIQILKEISKFEKDIFNSLQKGDKEYYKPLKIKSINFYKDPMRIQGIKASIVWNEIKDDSLSIINLNEGNSIDVVKVDINFKNIDKIKLKYPDIYNKLNKLLKNKDFEKGITTIAIPKDENVPEWVIDFIDYESIISDNCRYFPLESIGIYRGLENNNLTNILKI